MRKTEIIKLLNVVYVVLVACLLSLLCACSHERYPACLISADSLASAHPDSVRRVLASIAADTASMPESQRMYYKLLVLKANDKAYIRQKSDGAALQLVDYYEHGGDKRLLPQAYYYAASAYRDMNDAPQAIEYFQKALDVVDDDKDLRLKACIYSQMGFSFFFQGIENQALASFYKSFQIDSVRNDTMNMVTSLRNMSSAYIRLGDLNGCRGCLHEVEKLIGEANVELKHVIQYQYCYLLLHLKKYDSAWICIQEPLKNARDIDASAVYSTAAEVCVETNRVDSAEYFCRKLLSMGTVYAKQYAAKVLARMSFERKDPASAFVYVKQYETLTDSVEKIKVQEAVAKAAALYNYQIRERENTRLKMERQYDIAIFLSLALVGCIVVFLLVVYGIKGRQKHQRLKLELYLLKKMEKEHSEHSVAEIQNSRREIKQLLDRQQETNKNKEDLQKQLAELKAKLDSAIEEKKCEEIRHDEQRMVLLQSKSYALAKSKVECDKPLNRSEWCEMKDEFDALLGDFRYKLNQAYSLSDQEYYICMLIKLGFKNKEIGILVNRGANTVSQARKRLYTKITGKEDAPSSLDEFVNSL